MHSHLTFVAVFLGSMFGSGAYNHTPQACPEYNHSRYFSVQVNARQHNLVRQKVALGKLAGHPLRARLMRQLRARGDVDELVSRCKGGEKFASERCKELINTTQNYNVFVGRIPRNGGAAYEPETDASPWFSQFVVNTWLEEAKDLVMVQGKDMYGSTYFDTFGTAHKYTNLVYPWAFLVWCSALDCLEPDGVLSAIVVCTYYPRKDVKDNWKYQEPIYYRGTPCSLCYYDLLEDGTIWTHKVVGKGYACSKEFPGLCTKPNRDNKTYNNTYDYVDTNTPGPDALVLNRSLQKPYIPPDEWTDPDYNQVEDDDGVLSSSPCRALLLGAGVFLAFRLRNR